MLRTSTNDLARSITARPNWIWLLASLTWVVPLAVADEPVKSVPGTPVLNLPDGNFVSGSLDDSDQAGRIRWKSNAFLSPLEFDVALVQSIRFPTPERLPRPSGSFGFELTGGDTLYGSIVGLDEKEAELEVSRLGRIRLARSRLLRIFRWHDGADLIYNGPNGLAEWREIAEPKKKKPQANQQGAAAMIMMGGGGVAPAPLKPALPAGPGWTDEGGQLESSRDGSTIQAALDLPARVCLELELSWKSTPDFALAIGFTNEEESVDRAFRFEVWDKEIVAYRVLGKTAKLVSLQTLKDGPGRMQLQLYLDQEEGKLLIFSSTGESLGELKLGGRPDPALGNIRLTNIRGDIRLKRLRIGRWDGETPRPLANDQTRVHLTDQTSLRGQVERFDPTSREIVVKADSGEVRLGEDKISNVLFAQPEDKTPRGLRAIYQDGTRIGGDWRGVEKGSLVLASPGLASPIRLPMDGLMSLEMIPQEVEPRDKLDPTGTLEMDGVKLIGRLVDSGERPGDAVLAWKPLLGESSSPLRPGLSGKIIYRVPPAVPKPTAAQHAAAQQQAALRARRNGQPQNLLGGFIEAFQSMPKQPPSQRKSIYLRTGDVIPAEILSMDEKGVTFKTDLSSSNFVPHSRIKAVELSNDAGAVIRISKSKFERLLTLPRIQRDSPPTHLIRSENGDILRGRIASMDDKTIKLEVRLEEKQIDRDRVSRIIWLHADETDPTKKPAEPAKIATTNLVQAVRSDGIRLTFNAERFSDDTLTGKSDVLGECNVRMQDLDTLLIGGVVPKEATQLAYHNWKLQNAPDPKSAQMDDDGTPGGGAGTESSLVGKQAPDFELELVGGKKFHLAENKGKVIVLDFWATWCGPCVQAMPQIDKVTHEFAGKGVELIAVNLQESPAKINAMLERLKLSPTVALDRDGVVAAKYAANAIPQTVVIDREGKITRLFIGGGPKLGDQLREALEALMPKEKP